MCNHRNNPTAINPKSGVPFYDCDSCRAKSYIQYHCIPEEPLQGLGIFRTYVGKYFIVGKTEDLQGSEQKQLDLLQSNSHPIEDLQEKYNETGLFTYEAVVECKDKNAQDKILHLLKKDNELDDYCLNSYWVRWRLARDMRDTTITYRKSYNFIHKDAPEEKVRKSCKMFYQLYRINVFPLLRGTQEICGWSIDRE